MKISNVQGARSAVIDAVAPFLLEIKEYLPLFEEPGIAVDDGAISATLILSSRRADIPGEAVERVLAAVRKSSFSSLVSAQHRSGSPGLHLEISVHGFIVF